MSEIVKASTQYRDMFGTASVDGWDGIRTGCIAGCPKEYHPVGIEIYGEPNERGGEFNFSVYVLAVDKRLLDKDSRDPVRQLAQERPRLPVFRFSSKAKVEKILPKIKRISVVLQDRETEDALLALVDGDSSHDDDDEDEVEL